MTWTSHKISTAAIAYALRLPLEGIVVATLASTFPDGVEFLLHLRHRGISHFWVVYAVLFLIAHFNFLNLTLFSPKVNMILFLLLKWFSLGCLLHLFEDAMSKAGLELYPGSKQRIKLGELYTTRQGSEYLVVFLIVAICLGIKYWQVHTGQAVWRPEMLLGKQI